jgi:hypothetical protein
MITKPNTGGTIETATIISQNTSPRNVSVHGTTTEQQHDSDSR